MGCLFIAIDLLIVGIEEFHLIDLKFEALAPWTHRRRYYFAPHHPSGGNTTKSYQQFGDEMEGKCPERDSEPIVIPKVHSFHPCE